MAASFARITARLAEPTESIPPGLIDLINQNIEPPAKVDADDVYVRAMYLVSDQVNSFGGCFPVDEHALLCRLLIDSPVMVGHRKDKLPIGRTFHAVPVERDGCHWVKSYFYWLRSSTDAENLRENIDGGVYKECSIAFTFLLPECSICGRDIRQCRHEPLVEYETGGERRRCYFNYRRIERVLEASLVYRGAVPDTSITKDDLSAQAALSLESPNELEFARPYLIVPRYEGVLASAVMSDGRLLLETLGMTEIPDRSLETWQPESFRPTTPVLGMLVGYRGKERCGCNDLIAHFKARSGPISRVVFNLFPRQGDDRPVRVSTKSPFDVRLIPYRTAVPANLVRAGSEIMTRDGVELWPADEDYFHAARFHCRPDRLRLAKKPGYRVIVKTAAGYTILRFHSGEDEYALRISAFDKDRLLDGHWLVGYNTEMFGDTLEDSNDMIATGELRSWVRHGDGRIFESDGYLDGRFVLRPARLGGRACCLLYRLSPGGRNRE